MNALSKKILIVSITISLIFTIAFAQSIIHKLGGTSADDKFQVTDSEGDVKFAVQGDGNVEIPNGNLAVSGTGMWNHSGALVYDNLAAPTTWTDLDLSSVVGSNYALVMIKVKIMTPGGSDGYSFRPKGDTDLLVNGVESTGFTYPAAGLLICETNSNGILEWKSDITLNSASLWVLGYIK